MPSVSWQHGLQIDLDKVPKKYAGLDGTEIAISESQERMAVVVDPKDVEQFLAYAAEENLEAVDGGRGDRGAASGDELERQEISWISAVRSWIPTALIRRQTSLWRSRTEEGNAFDKTGRCGRCPEQVAELLWPT